MGANTVLFWVMVGALVCVAYFSIWPSLGQVVPMEEDYDSFPSIKDTKIDPPKVLKAESAVVTLVANSTNHSTSVDIDYQSIKDTKIDPPKLLQAESAVVNLVANPTNHSTSVDIDYQSIMEKWQIPTAALPILKEIQSRPVGFDYNRETDILALRHPLKTGGTSFSMTLRERFGPSGVLPGSGKSEWFKKNKFEDAIKEHPPEEDTEYWDNIKVLFTHTHLRRNEERHSKTLLDKLREAVPSFRKKRFRLMTIVRKPIDQAASSFYETICRIGYFSGGRQVTNATECPEVDLKEIVNGMKRRQQECNDTQETSKKSGCQWIVQKKDSFFEICGSIDKLLDSGLVHNKHYLNLMGSLPAPPEKEGSKTPTMEEVSIRTIRDLGGLIDDDEKYKEDMAWFAITERMTESLCLFYYRFKIEPVKEQPRALYKHCRPINLWDEKQILRHDEENEFDITVWRAANAVMDVRMEDMRLEIKARLASGETLDGIPYLGEGCYADASDAFTPSFKKRRERKKTPKRKRKR